MGHVPGKLHGTISHPNTPTVPDSPEADLDYGSTPEPQANSTIVSTLDTNAALPSITTSVVKRTDYDIHMADLGQLPALEMGPAIPLGADRELESEHYVQEHCALVQYIEPPQAMGPASITLTAHALMDEIHPHDAPECSVPSLDDLREGKLDTMEDWLETLGNLWET